jgi:hypothetical protein
MATRTTTASPPPQPARSTERQAAPDERDAPAGRQVDRPSAPLRQAYRDILRGVQDTSRATEAGKSYKKLKQR